MPAPNTAQKKKTAAAPKQKKLSAKQQQALLERQQKHKRFYMAYGLGFVTLLLLALAFIPGQSAWATARSWLWSISGITLLPWLAFSLYCCSVWLRNRNLRSDWLNILFSCLLIIFLGTAVSLISSGESMFFHGGFLPTLLGGWLSTAFGQVAAITIFILALLASIPLAFAPLRENVYTRMMERRTEQPDKPEKVSPEPQAPAAKPGKKTKSTSAATIIAEDELYALEQLANEPTEVSSEKKGFWGNLQDRLVGTEQQSPDGGIPTVLELDPLSPTDDHAAGNLAESLTPDDGSKRRRAKLAGEDAARAAAMEAQIDEAMNAEGEQDYRHPPISCLSAPRGNGAKPDQNEEELIARRLVHTLESFGVSIELVGRSRGPSVTRYELRPAEGVKISKITALSDDIALRLAATKVRIEAPIPGKPAVGVEVPNRVRATVSLREIIDSDVYRKGTRQSKLTVALGKDIVGDLVVADLSRLPHMLIAGTTGSGKSVCMNALILSLMYNASPDDVKLLMIDPKQVEFNIYSGIPHLLVPVVSDPLKAAGALGWAVNEMEHRYSRISEQNVRDVDSYNNIAAMQDDLQHMPRIVIFIDELSDLMMVAPSDVEDSIQRIAQKGRAAGMHLVVATQRPSVDVITGVIKSNLPGRIALSVASQIDSRTIINAMGAEQLLGNGDMLFSPNGGNNAVRVQGCYVSDPEVQKVVTFVKNQENAGEGYNDDVWKEIERNAANAGRGKKKGGMLDANDAGDEEDPLFDSAVEVVVNAQMASTTMLQKKLKLGYARASRIVDLLEEKGIVGPPEGSKPRKVLISPAQWQEYCAQGSPQFDSNSEE